MTKKRIPLRLGMKMRMNKKKQLMIFFVLFLGLFLVGRGAMAGNSTTTLDTVLDNGISGGIGYAVSLLLGAIAMLFTTVSGLLITMGVSLLGKIGSYNQFIDVATVVQGWIVVRDICNLLIVMIMLVIAFSVILRRDSYNLKMVPKLLMYAVLINFSRSIFGIMIDFSQYIMLSFMGAFPDSYFIEAFQVKNLLSVATSAKGIENWTLVASIIAGMFASFVTLVVVWVLVLVLVYRIIQLWIYTILSPLAFLGMGFAPLGKHTAQIWNDFIDQLIVGPILALFIWLALATMDKTAATISLASPSSFAAANSTTNYNDAAQMCVGISKFFCDVNLQKYLLTVALLIGGLTVSKKFAGKAAGVISSGLSRIDKGQDWLHKQTIGRAEKIGGRAVDIGADAAKLGSRLYLSGFSGVDRLGGRMLSAGVNKVSGGKVKFDNLAEKGIINGMAQGIFNAPGNFIASVNRSLNKDNDIKTKARDIMRSEHLKDGNNAYVNYGGKKYWVDKDEHYREDKGGYDESIAAADNFIRIGEKKVKRMTEREALTHDTWNGVGGAAKAASDDAEMKAINDHIKDFDGRNMTVDQLRAIANDLTSSATKREAAALKVAMKEGLSDFADTSKMRSLLAGNAIATKQFNDEVYKKQAHIANNLDTDDGRSALAKAFDTGKVDYTKQSAAAFKNGIFQEIAKNYHGDEFDRIQASAYNRGDAKTKEAIATGLTKLKEILEKKMNDSGLPEDDDKYKKMRKEWDGMSSMHAKLTGDVKVSFLKEDGSVDETSVRKHFKTSKAAVLNEIDKDSFEELNKKMGEDKLYKIVQETMDLAKIKSMNNLATNPIFVEHVVAIKRDESTAVDDAINGDNTLRDIAKKNS